MGCISQKLPSARMAGLKLVWCLLASLSLLAGRVQTTSIAGFEDTEVLVCDWGTPGRILNVSLTHMNFSSLPLTNSPRPVALDYDPGNFVLYWTDVFTKQIRRTDLSTQQDQLLLQLSTNATPDGIAVDIEDGLVFFTDTGNNVVARVGSKGQEVIVSDDLEEPRAIVAYHDLRRLYWTDWGKRPKIESISYDGSGRTTIVDTRLLWPNGLALDSQNSMLYWCDAKRSAIEVVGVEGRGRRVVLTEPTAHYFDLFYHRGVIFFTDWARPTSLLHVPVRGGKVGHFVSKGFNQLAGLYVIDRNPGNGTFALPDIHDNSCVHCLNSTGCDRMTARCPYGCDDGWTGDTCSIDQSEGEMGSGSVSTPLSPTTDWSIQANKSENVEQETPTHRYPNVRPVTGSHQSWLKLSPGMVASVALGCVTVALMFAIVLLLVIRRRRMKSDDNLLVEWRPEQAFTNNTYTLMAGDTEEPREDPSGARAQVYLVPCEDKPPEDHLYDDIDEMKKELGVFVD